MSNYTNEDKTGIGLSILGIVFLLVTTIIVFIKSGLWNDEFFSLYITTLPFDDLITRASQDVHPVLYYLILKIFIDTFSQVIDTVSIARFVSIIPFYLLAIISLTKVRKDFGMLTAGIFLFCISSMPQMMLMACEVRMYSWALFFVTLSLIYAYEITNTSTVSKWIALTLLSVCSAYTHYFSAIASIIIYLGLVVYIIQKNRTLIKNWLISSIIAILAFMPWTGVVLSQISSVNGNFWIAPITLNTIVSYIYYVLSPAEIFIKANELVFPTILGTLMLVGLCVLIYIYHDKFTNNCIIAFLLLPLTGILLSQIISPIFHQRYMTVSLGILWLAFSVLLSKSFDDKKIFIPILAITLIVGCVGLSDFINIQTTDDLATQSEADMLNEVVGTNNTVICGSHKFRFPIANYYLLNDYVVCIEDNLESNISKLFNNSTSSKIFYINYPGDDSIYQTSFNITEIEYNGTILEKEVNIYEIRK